MAKLIIRMNDGSKKELDIDGAIAITVEDKGMRVEATLPRTSEDGYIRSTGQVHTVVFLDKITNKDNPPDVTLCVGEFDKDGFKWRTDAMLYVSHSGRIIAKNQTLGYASTEKPVATMPWKRSK